MAAPVLASSASFADTSNQTSRTINKPSGTASGDWLFLAVSIDLSGTITTPTGFTEVFKQPDVSATMTLALYKRKADGTEGSTFTIATSSEIANGIIVRVTGADSTEALDVFCGWQSELNASRSTGVLPTLEAYAACSDGSLVLQIAAFDGGSGSFSATPSGYTSVAAVGANISGTHMSMYSKEYASAGYIGVGSWTFNTSTEMGWGLTVVIRASTATSFPAQPVIRCMNALHHTNATAGVILKPHGTVDNDLLLLVQTSRTSGGTGLTPPGTFTQIQADSDGASVSHQAHYRIASSEGSSYTVASSSANSLLSALMRIVNADTTTPINTSSVAKGTSATPTASTITPSVDNCLILFTEGNDDDEVTTGGGAPSGFDIVYSESNDDGTDCGIIIARDEQTTAAATGSIAGSFTASEDWVAIAIAIAPLANTRSGSVSQTLGNFTLSATGTVALAGVLSQTLGNFTGTLTGAVALKADVTQTLGNITGAITGAHQGFGDVTQTLGDFTLASTGTVALKGVVSVTLGAITLASTGVLPLAGVVNATLGNFTLSSTGVLPLAGVVNATLGNFTSVATGTLLNTGTLTASIGAFTLSAEGENDNTATGTPSVYIPVRRRRRVR